MKLKKYFEFLKESVSSDIYWISELTIKDIFQSIIDEGFVIKSSKVFWGYTGYFEGNLIESTNTKLHMFDIDQDDVIFRKESYYPGWRIQIDVRNSKFQGDITDDFLSAISQLRGEGYKIEKIEDDDGRTNLENPVYGTIHFVDSNVYIWVPERPGKEFTLDREQWSQGDVLLTTSWIYLYISQNEEIVPTEAMLAEFYQWNCDRIDGNSIYCHVDIEDMARSLLSRRSFQEYGTMLCDGIDISNYWGDTYQVDIDNLFYHLSKENSELMLKCVIREFGGLENFVSECKNPELLEKSESEVISFLLKEPYHRTLEKVLNSSEITDTIRQTVSDWEREAHCDANQKDLEKAFESVIEKAGIKWTKKLYKPVEKFYTKKLTDGTSERVPYQENVQFYELPFQDVWIEEYGKSNRRCSLRSVFLEWTSDVYFDYELNPRFSDWGDVNTQELNQEILIILNHNLK